MLRQARPSEEVILPGQAGRQVGRQAETRTGQLRQMRRRIDLNARKAGRQATSKQASNNL